MAFTGFIGPLVIFCVKQNSTVREISFVASAALACGVSGIIFVFMALFIVVMMTS